METPVKQSTRQAALSAQGRSIRAEINILAMTLRADGTIAVQYEFPYRAGGARRWCKQVEILPDSTAQPVIYQRLYERVQALRAEIEQ